MGQKPFDFITTRTQHPIDKGWSWVVMMAAFGSLFIVIGYQRSFGILFVLFQEKHGYSSAHVSAVNGTQMLTYCFSTMFVMNFLLKKISVRTSALCGCCLQAIGIMATSLSSNIISLIVFQGFFFGLGHSMLYCPTILIVSQYFEQRRSLATAIAMCGSSAGGITFPYITRILYNTFGLEGALLLLGGIVFNQNVFFALYQPIQIENGPKEQSQISTLSPPDDQPMNNNLPSVVVMETNDEKTSPKEEDFPLNKDNELGQILIKTVSHPDHSLKTDSQLHNRLSSSQILKPVTHTEHKHDNLRLYSSQVLVPRQPSARDNNPVSNSREFLRILGTPTTGFGDLEHCSMPALTGSLMQLKKGGSLLHTQEDQLAVQKSTLLGENGDEELSDVSEDLQYGWIPQVMRLGAFWLIAFYFVGGIIGAGCPAVFIPALAKERGMDENDGAFFLMISAVADFVARVLSALILHFNLIDPCNLALIPLFLNFLFFNLTPILNEFYSVLLLALNYGFCSSLFWTLQSLVVIDVLGLENLGSALGFYAVIYALTTSASYPFAGWLHDEFGTYSASFIYFGAMSILAASALIVAQLPKYRARLKAMRLCSPEEQTVSQDDAC